MRPPARKDLHFYVADWRFGLRLSHFPCVILERGERWNDYGYETQFTAYFVRSPSARRARLGTVKILDSRQLNLAVLELSRQPKERSTVVLPSTFTRLGKTFCSLGQSASYYQRVERLLGASGPDMLARLGDVRFAPNRLKVMGNHEAVELSLLRAPSAQEVFHGYKPASKGLAPRTPTVNQETRLAFDLELPWFAGPHNLRLSFDLRPGHLGRLCAVVGRNGVGKTSLLRELANAASGLSVRQKERLTITRGSISSVLIVSFSPFDRFTRPRSRLKFPYEYCGILTPSNRLDREYSLGEFVRNIEQIERTGLWTDWAATLRATGIPMETPTSDSQIESPRAQRLWADQLSSGHTAVVFALAAITAHLTLNTLLLVDEPESHLHPHLLSRMMRTIHSLLERRNAIAVVATHSPLLLQEVPGRFVRVLDREGLLPLIHDYPGESFGENLSELVRSGYGLNSEERNYISRLRESAHAMNNTKAVRGLFKEGLNSATEMQLERIVEDS